MRKLRPGLQPSQDTGLPVEIDLGDRGISIGSAFFDIADDIEIVWDYYALFLDTSSALILLPRTKAGKSRRDDPTGQTHPPLTSTYAAELVSQDKARYKGKGFMGFGTYERVGIVEFVKPENKPMEPNDAPQEDIDLSKLKLEDLKYADGEKTWGLASSEDIKVDVKIV